MMASTKRGQQDSKPFSDLMAAVSVFVALLGIGLATLLGVLAVKDLLGEPWFAILLILSIVLTLGSGAGGIYWFVAAQEKETPFLVALIRGFFAGGMSPWILWILIWFIPLTVTVFTLGLWLLAKGSKGNEIFGLLLVPMSIVTLGIIVLLYQISRKIYTSVAPLRPAALLTSIVLGLGCSLLYWTVIHKTDIPVTDRVVVSSGEGMQNGGQAAIQIPGTPPQRSHLALIPILTNFSKVGDCVNPAQLDVTTVIDGQQRRSVRVRPGHEARLDLTSVTHQASVTVTLHVQDPSCTVDLSVGQAILYN